MAKFISNNGSVCQINTKRGEHVTIDVHALALAWADFLSDKANEERQGWNLSTSWFEDEIKRVKRAGHAA